MKLGRDRLGPYRMNNRVPRNVAKVFYFVRVPHGSHEGVVKMFFLSFVFTYSVFILVILSTVVFLI